MTTLPTLGMYPPVPAARVTPGPFRALECRCNCRLSAMHLHAAEYAERTLQFSQHKTKNVKRSNSAAHLVTPV